MNKYGNRGVYYSIKDNSLLTPESLNPMGKKGRSDLIHFASLHEYKVFEFLVKLNSCELYLQHKIELISPNTVEIYPRGKHWIVDFMLKTKNGTLIPIEAKGKIMRDFPMILALLELHKPKLYQNLWIIFPKVIPPMFQKKAFAEANLKNRILTMKDLSTKLITQITSLNCY